MSEIVKAQRADIDRVLQLACGLPCSVGGPFNAACGDLPDDLPDEACLPCKVRRAAKLALATIADGLAPGGDSQTCEGCDQSSTAHDADGVPLCRDCWLANEATQ